jgi:hypothetical protein
MRLPGSKKLVAGVAAVTLLSGGAGAFAATQLSSSPRQAYINDVARRLNVTPTALTSAMKHAMIDQINAAQKAGKLTAAQASAAKSRIESGHAVGGFGGPGGPGPGFASGARRSGQGRFACGGSSTTTTTTSTPCKGGPPGGFRGHFGQFFGCGGGSSTTTTTSTPCKGGPPGGFRGHFGRFSCNGQSTKTTTSTSTTSATAKPCPGGPGFGQHPGFAIGIGFGPGLFGLGGSALTSYLGISAATLRSDLAAGKSLAQIASAISGKSVSGLELVLRAADKTQLDKTVSAGSMTSAQEAKALSALSSQLSKLVNRSFKFSGAGRFHSSRKP